MISGINLSSLFTLIWEKFEDALMTTLVPVVASTCTWSCLDKIDVLVCSWDAWTGSPYLELALVVISVIDALVCFELGWSM